MEENEVYYALPVHMVHSGDKLIFRRGRSSYQVDAGEVADAMVETLAKVASRAMSLLEYSNQFDDDEKEFRGILFQQLSTWRFIVPKQLALEVAAVEQPEDIYFWELNTTKKKFEMQLNNRRLSIFGINAISVEIANHLKNQGHDNFQMVSVSGLDDHTVSKEVDHAIISQGEYLNAINVEERGIECLICTSTNGNQMVLRNWNSFAFANGMTFFPIQLHKYVGFIGPFVVPGELPCYECMYRRRLSHLGDPETEMMLDKAVEEGDPVTGYHASMVTMLTHYAIHELNKVLSMIWQANSAGSIIELNPSAAILKKRKVLKAPYCPVCGPDKVVPSTSMFKSSFRQK